VQRWGFVARVLILPGLGDSGPQHWQTLWQRSDPRMRRVEQHDWQAPRLDAWCETLERAVGASAEPTFLVAHSLGCALVAHWSARTRTRCVRGALLVAPADVESPRHTPDCARNFAPLPRDSLGFPSVLVASRDDPYMSFARARALASAWGAQLVDAGARGHLNAESGLGTWPEGFSLLRGLSFAQTSAQTGAPRLLFLHANGYPPLAYRALLAPLAARFRIRAPALWDEPMARTPHKVQRWTDLAGAALEELDEADPCVLVGHSMGALIAAHLASAYPRRIRRVVLLDPPVLSRALLAALALMPPAYRARGVMAQKARERARSWPDRYAAFAHFRDRPAFARIADDVLWDYVHAGTLEAGHGATALLFPPELELQLNTVPPNTWRALGPGLSPLRLIRGTLSHLLSTRHLRRWSRLRPADELVELRGVGHLLPFEQPALVAEHIARDPTPRSVLP
jgi:uncharacterized protein